VDLPQRLAAHIDPAEQELIRPTVNSLLTVGGPANGQRAAFTRCRRLTDVIDMLAGSP
jgi:hypothetical protein